MPFHYLASASDIKSGFATSTGTLLTIPAGKRFMGYVSVHAYATTATTETATVTVSGTNATPASGSTVARALVNGLALTSLNDWELAPVMVAAPAGNDITLELTLSGSGTGSAAVTGHLF